MEATNFSLVPLNDLSVIKISGDDAENFLHGQLTQDISGMAPKQARLAGYCTPKGRLLASLVIWRDLQHENQFVALVKADIAEALVKRLTMFVLRAKVKLESAPLSVWAAAPELGTTETNELHAHIPSAGAPAWTVVQNEAGTWVSAPRAQADTQRWWLITPQNGAAVQNAENGANAWRCADIAAGLPWIESAIQDLFIPQTLNFDLIEGVHFTKGCYPGQEVVARSHYRGTIKRRMAYGFAQTEPTEAITAGADIFDAERPDSPAGRIINVAAHQGQIHMLLEVHLSDLEAADYRLESAQGASIQIQPMPYSIDSADAKAE